MFRMENVEAGLEKSIGQLHMRSSNKDRACRTKQQKEGDWGCM